MKILHLGGNEIFLPPFINFVKNNFVFQEHEFILTSGLGNTTRLENVKIYQRKVFERILYYVSAFIKAASADKIILHGIFDIKLLMILLINPWSFKKCFWVLWGGDLYLYNTIRRERFWFARELVRRYVIRNVGFITTMVPGDYDYAKKWYKTQAKFIPNLMYLSHISRDANTIKCQIPKKTQLYIQIGNSSDPGNNHEEIFLYLSKLQNQNIKVFCPLSYGSEEHKLHVIKMGVELLGDKFVPITKMMNFEEYNNYMACIDVAIFNHDRQQAMGNIIGLLSLGKKVALKKTITPYHFFGEIGVVVYSLEDDLSIPIEEHTKISNIRLMNNYFSVEKLKHNWSSVFNEK